MSSTGPEPRSAFVLGAARSGTSLIYKMLCLHPDASYISNYLRRVPSAWWLGGLNRIPRRVTSVQREVWLGGGAQGYAYGHPRSVLRRAAPQPVEGEPVFTRAGFREYPWESEGPERLRTERLRQTVTRLSSASGASVFVSKRIAHNQRIPQLLQALPEARFVAIVRDGRAVALSLSRVNWWPDDPLWWDGRSPRELEAEGADPWELCARNWVEDMRSIEEGLTDVPADRVLRLRYEDVVAAPRDAVVGVGRFIGLDADPRWLRALDMVRTQDRPEKWRTLPPQALATVERVQRSTLLHYGYDV